jgi:hypothetical protein
MRGMTVILHTSIGIGRVKSKGKWGDLGKIGVKP